jgi:hypothetical protein
LSQGHNAPIPIWKLYRAPGRTLCVARDQARSGQPNFLRSSFGYVHPNGDSESDSEWGRGEGVGGTTVTHSQKKVVAEAGGDAGNGLTLTVATTGIEVRVWVVGGDSLTTTVEEVRGGLAVDGGSAGRMP